MKRFNNRNPNQLRPFQTTVDYTNYAEGSVLIETGQTRVLCNVSITDDVPRWREESGGGWLTAEYSMLPRSTHTRINRRRATDSSRSKEISRLIGRSLRAALDLDKLGQRTLTVDCDVIQADGGTRTASITGGYIAVALALQPLIKMGAIPPEVLKTAVAAVSVGVVQQTLLLDLDYEEDSTAEVDLNVVMTQEGKFIELQGTAEGEPFDHETMLGLITLAQQGIATLIEKQSQVLGK